MKVVRDFDHGWRALGQGLMANTLGAGGKTLQTSARDGMGAGVLLNASPSAFRRIRAKLGNAAVGAGNAVICGIGDSITRGTDPSNGATGGANGILPQMGNILTARGFNCAVENVFGNGGYEGAFNSYEGRISVTGSFVNSSGGGIVGFGGQIFRATAAGTLTFVTTRSGDRLDLRPLNNGASFSYTVDGGAPITVNTPNTSTIGKTTIDCGSDALHTIVINWISGTVYINGFHAYKSTWPGRVDILNGAWHGSKIEQWTYGSFWTYEKFVSSVSADLVIWAIAGTNNWRASSPAGDLATFKTDFATRLGVVKALPSAPDILLVTPPPDGNTIAGSNIAIQQQYVDAVIDYAFSAGLPVYDRWRSWGDEATMRGYGAMNADKLHPTRSGYRMDAEKLVSVILGK